MNSLNNYVRFYDFTCNFSLSMIQNEETLPVAEESVPYKFNVVEKLGRALQAPFCGTIRTFNATHSKPFQAALIIAGIVCSVFAACGKMLEAIGSLCNPKAALREESFKKLQEIYQLLHASFDRDVDFASIRQPEGAFASLAMFRPEYRNTPAGMHFLRFMNDSVMNHLIKNEKAEPQFFTSHGAGISYFDINKPAETTRIRDLISEIQLVLLQIDQEVKELAKGKQNEAYLYVLSGKFQYLVKSNVETMTQFKTYREKLFKIEQEALQNELTHVTAIQSLRILVNDFNFRIDRIAYNLDPSLESV